MRDEDHNVPSFGERKTLAQDMLCPALGPWLDLLVSKLLHDKRVSGADVSDQAGVTGGKCIALHSHTLMETGIHSFQPYFQFSS